MLLLIMQLIVYNHLTINTKQNIYLLDNVMIIYNKPVQTWKTGFKNWKCNCYHNTINTVTEKIKYLNTAL